LRTADDDLLKPVFVEDLGNHLLPIFRSTSI
jgi:hypothetical protein